MSAPTSIYRRAPTSGALRQGEIVSNLIQTKIRLDSIGAEQLVVDEIEHEYAVVVSQDCDLDWDWNARESKENQSKLMSGVLFCEAVAADVLAQDQEGIYSERRYIISNRSERYQFLQGVSRELDLLNQGLPELIVDFKRYFTLPVEEVYARLDKSEGTRRSLLTNPYLLHLITRFCYFQYRVALPEQHYSEPFKRAA